MYQAVRSTRYVRTEVECSPPQQKVKLFMGLSHSRMQALIDHVQQPVDHAADASRLVHLLQDAHKAKVSLRVLLLLST